MPSLNLKADCSAADGDASLPLKLHTQTRTRQRDCARSFENECVCVVCVVCVVACMKSMTVSPWCTSPRLLLRPL